MLVLGALISAQAVRADLTNSVSLQAQPFDLQNVRLLDSPFRDAMTRTLDCGYAGSLGFSSAAVMADFVVVDMFAEACSGQQKPKEAASRAEQRALRYYKA